MKSLVDLWSCAANELAAWCHTSATLDINTVKRRVKDEGISFVTITLPTYSKSLERGLANGKVVPADFPSFHGSSGCLPNFMSGFIRQVFDLDSGRILENPNIDAIFAIRFLSNLFAKIELPCSNSRVTRAMQDYLECELEVEEWECTVSAETLDVFREASRLLFADVFATVDELVFSGNIQPRHGPGSTAERLTGNRKIAMREWTQRLERIFPFGEYALPIWRYFDDLDHVNFLAPEQERPVRVVHVPKTLRAPRIIAMEPVCMQYMQQGLLRPLVEALERPVQATYNRTSLCYGMLGFSDQAPNRAMAKRGSSDGSLATLDLKEASDRVPNLLVKVMLERHPWLDTAVQACRSTRAEISDLGICIPKLSKFASMGSALCFPFEAMVFLAIIFVGISKHTGLPLSRQLISSYRGKVRVYGDDIIVPVDVAESVISALESYGIKCNTNKSFWTGQFRESCGGDYFAGEDVTPIRMHKVFPSSRKDATEVAALVEFRNHLYMRDMWQTASFLDEKIRDILPDFPIVEATSPCLGRLSFWDWNPEWADEDTHAPLVRGWVIRPIIGENLVEDVWALVKCLSSPIMFEDIKHLERSGRCVAVTLKRRWVTPY